MMNEQYILDGAEVSSALNIRELKGLALKGLGTMFDPQRQQFCFRLKRDGVSSLIQDGYHRRYTIIALLGLQQAAAEDSRPVVDVRDVLSSLLRNTKSINDLGDLGLLLWLCALVRPERLKEISSNLRVEDALSVHLAGRQCRTMELAWFLSGLAHAALAFPAIRPALMPLALRSYHLLVNNQGEEGIFGHSATGRTLAGLFRGHIGSFADQVYSIYALTRFAQAYQAELALRRALCCANAICKAQGPLGQWWWHYDASTGRILQRYPVYSVHQDGMAPMALFAIGEAAGVDFRHAIHKGLAWINGRNELNCDLREPSSGVIWRSIYRPKTLRKYIEEAGECIRPSWTSKTIGGLRILFECRPYHLGWLLYALAGQSDRRKRQ